MHFKFLISALLLLVALTVRSGETFRWQAEEQPGKLIVSVEIGEGAYLYADQVIFRTTGDDPKPLVPVEIPEATKFSDSLQGDILIYPTGKYKWTFEGANPFAISVSYQGCRNSICFLPAEFVYPASEQADAQADAHFRKLEGLSTTRQFIAFLENADPPEASKAPEGVSWGWIGLILLGGLALNLTPCVLPMIPVTLSIIGVGQERKASSGFILGMLYGVGLAAVYGVLGILAVIAGVRLGTLNSSPFFNWIIAAIFCYLGLAMLGYLPFDLSRLLPDKILTKLDRGEKQGLWRHGVAAFIFGVIGALLAGACVAPVVTGVLIFSAREYAAGDPMAIIWPFVLGIGMALPWPLAGAGLKILPRPAKFTLWVKYAFGAIILVGAVYFALQGWTLRSYRFKVWVELRNLAEAQHRSKSEGKPLLIYFGASWCKNCTAMEIQALSDPEVKAKLQNFVFCKFRAEELDEVSIKRVLDFYQISGLPAFVIENEER